MTNKIFLKFLIASIAGICVGGWFYTEINAQNKISQIVVPNKTVHFGNLRTENNNLFVEAKHPPNYLFDITTTACNDVRTWEIKKNTRGIINYKSEKIDHSKEKLHKVYTPSFRGELLPDNDKKGTGENPTWELTGAFVMEDLDFEIEIAPLKNLSDVRNEFGVGEKFRVYAVVKNDDPRYRKELAIKSVAITRKGRAVSHAVIKKITKAEDEDFIYQISLASCSASQTEENAIRRWDFDVEVAVDISGEEYVKNTTATVYSPKLVSGESEAHDFRAELGAVDMYGIGFFLKSRSLKPQNVSYAGLWFKEGVCEGETTGICSLISNKEHQPLKRFQIPFDEDMGTDRCYFYLPKWVFLKGTEGTWNWKIPQQLSLRKNGEYVTFAYLTQAFSCQVVEDKVIDKTIDNVHYVRQLKVDFTISKNDQSLSETKIIRYSENEIKEYGGLK